MIFKAAIFDLDGTLINSLQDLAASANAVLREQGFPEHGMDSYRYFVGNGMKKLMERCLPKEKATDEAFVAKATARCKEIYAAHTLDHTKPYDGIVLMLERLQTMGIPMAVCTNKPQEEAKSVVASLFPQNFFHMVIGDSEGQPPKPDPTKVLHIAKGFRLAPKEIAYFGDSSVDMDTACNGGLLPVGVLWGFRPKEELIEHGARILLDTPSELLAKVHFSYA